jgi:hypothetical protein
MLSNVKLQNLQKKSRLIPSAERGTRQEGNRPNVGPCIALLHHSVWWVCMGRGRGLYSPATPLCVVGVYGGGGGAL